MRKITQTLNNFCIFNDISRHSFLGNILTVFYKTKYQILYTSAKKYSSFITLPHKVRTIKIHSREIISKDPIISQRNELKIERHAHGTAQIKAGRTPTLNLLDSKSPSCASNILYPSIQLSQKRPNSTN